MKNSLAAFIAFVRMREHVGRNYYSVINTILIVCMIDGGLWLFFFEKPWLTYKSDVFHVVGNDFAHGVVATFKPGDVVPLALTRCSSASQPRSYGVGRRLVRVDKTIATIVIAGNQADIDPGPCEDVVSRVNALPREIAPGKPLPCGRYYIRGFAEVQGYVRVNAVTWRSEEFEVSCDP